MHAKPCIPWSKYTTDAFSPTINPHLQFCFQTNRQTLQIFPSLCFHTYAALFLSKEKTKEQNKLRKNITDNKNVQEITGIADKRRYKTVEFIKTENSRILNLQ